MLVYTFLIISLGIIGSLASYSNKPVYLENDAMQHFEDFIKNYNKQYSSEEEKLKRFEIFKQNLKFVNSMNAEDDNAEYGITQFSDIEIEEFAKISQSPKPLECKLLADTPIMISGKEFKCKKQTIDKSTVLKSFNVNMKNRDLHNNKQSIPDTFDWREHNAVTRVKYQRCGDCWTFSTSGNVEGQYAIKHNELVELSQQQMLDCDESNNGCGGGQLNISMSYLVKAGGLMTEQDYPYKGTVQECKIDTSKITAHVSDCVAYDLKDEEKLKELLVYQGPIGIAIDADACRHQLKNYKQGIIQSKNSGAPSLVLNHAVLLVGYGLDEKKEGYWIVKNSWGADWGEKGYMRLKIGQNQCGLMNECAGTVIVS